MKGGSSGGRGGGGGQGGGRRPQREPRSSPRAPLSAPVEDMRIQRALARAGVASRRASEQMVLEGRVTVNGEVATTGQVVDSLRDDIRVDGKPVKPPPSREAVWLALHKPAGVVTTRKDERGRDTVFELLPDVPGLTYVGRLDFLTEGLLIFTTDGNAAHRLTHPSAELPRTYLALVRGDAEGAAAALSRGVDLEDGLARASDVKLHNVGRRLWELELTITEGRNREVRRMCEAVGLQVERLMRTSFGPVRLGNLASGEYRPLGVTEISRILSIVSR